MNEPSREEMSAFAAAMRWVQYVTSVGLEMALPAGLGYWLDTLWGTGPWLLVTGTILGFVTGMTHLLQLARATGTESKPKRQQKGSDR